MYFFIYIPYIFNIYKKTRKACTHFLKGGIMGDSYVLITVFNIFL